MSYQDTRFRLKAPGGMCKAHLETRLGYRNMYFNPVTGNRWPGHPGSPFDLIGPSVDAARDWRAREWDEKAAEQMRLTEEICLKGTSSQCSSPRTCTGCAMFTCRCPAELEVTT